MFHRLALSHGWIRRSHGSLRGRAAANARAAAQKRDGNTAGRTTGKAAGGRLELPGVAPSLRGFLRHAVIGQAVADGRTPGLVDAFGVGASGHAAILRCLCASFAVTAPHHHSIVWPNHHRRKRGLSTPAKNNSAPAAINSCPKGVRPSQPYANSPATTIPQTIARPAW